MEKLDSSFISLKFKRQPTGSAGLSFSIGKLTVINKC